MIYCVIHDKIIKNSLECFYVSLLFSEIRRNFIKFQIKKSEQIFNNKLCLLSIQRDLLNSNSTVSPLLTTFVD